MKYKSIPRLGLKLTALALAIITWFYVNGELKKENANSRKSFQEDH